MGVFDSFLKAIGDGSVEKALSGATGKLESSIDRAAGKVEVVASKVEQKISSGESTAVTYILRSKRPYDTISVSTN